MTSLEMPVGRVARTQAGYERRGSRLLWQPCRSEDVSHACVCVGPRRAEKREGTYIIEIDIDAAVVDEDKVTNGVCTLDGIGVMVPSI